MAEREAWFEYWTDGRRFKAMPINWKGWVSLLVVATAPGVSLALAARWLGDRFGALAGLPALLLALALSFAAIYGLVRARGRPRKT
ncbi:MAG: hypothetical protein KKE02_07050 [Alphaproteobacteria bacterium]|nr:hypothetical protein [Alphaproteobacteria bacterium]MBU1515520.1 hypothetical protein [Alphaproteobacteria bacterium]MBU2095518.1 hypothetical protein [Alphaproteobacteria bacterium]MBU2150759.1 hypothetical protein [Alphaproteobacteria bacterium]MBU2307024.1 hypothetical protein [Alphaproteobacteria bacterium]